MDGEEITLQKGAKLTSPNDTCVEYMCLVSLFLHSIACANYIQWLLY